MRFAVADQPRQVAVAVFFVLPRQRALAAQLLDLVRPEFSHLGDHRGRNGVGALAGADQQRLGDCEVHRQVDAETGALAGLAVDLDAPADRGGLALDHVHPDTAAGDLRQAGRGREPRHEDQVGQAFLVEFLVGLDQPVVERALPDSVEIESGAVVREFDQDFVAFLGEPQRDLADPGLAGGVAGLGRFDAMGDRVAQ